MAASGHNSILFDVFSIIDKELSLLKFMMNEYKDEELEFFDLSKIRSMSDDELKYMRMYGVLTPFISSIKKDFSTSPISVRDKLYSDNETEILENYAVLTDMPKLIEAYRITGDGVVKTAIRCETESQRKFISKNIDTDIEFCKNDEVDTKKYTRFIVGDCRTPTEYNLDSPKSILVVNFRENFAQANITMLNPELVISLGDINEINIIYAYNELENKINNALG